ncbi:MAG TPA: hypothetical protein PLO78_01245 [Candidatus Omnitrophota bacterium]|nr:hypothetical protein [Candidatus Omnitrophota bacterium]
MSVDLKKPYPDVRTYSLDVSSQGHVPYAGSTVSLRFNTFSAVPQAADRYLAYRTGETTFESDFYNQFITAPAELIQDQAAAWLKSSPLVKYILKAGETSSLSYIVDGTLLDLYGDYRNVNAPKAVLRLKLTVSKTGDTAGVVWQKIYAQEVSMSHISPLILTEGWNKGLCQIVADFENDLKALISNTPQ